MRLTESQLRSIIRKELQEMMTPEFGESDEQKLGSGQVKYGKKLGYKYDEESDQKAQSIANNIINAMEEIKRNPELAMNVANLVFSEGHIQLSQLIKSLR